ncbi:MAG: hypothetical protein D6702_00610 [Planctomycetota bacterium]|nr:MAG: hypothetical protein D6702_00610 [Planctomycetota bacterium]
MKNLLRLSLGLALLGGSATLVVPDEATGFSTIGGNLGLTQRDCRIYDNFTDAAAHNNTQPHPNWPGYTEIELSCWKAMAEWGSRKFGDGSGDSTQFQIGDGRANFNFFWNGEASGVGGYNANINSPIAGSSGGVLAYTETPISDGWRIRYYEAWTWSDGPDQIGPGEMDFQGVATHELGHALGLGHSNDPAATMYAYASGNGVPDRSIEQDDRDGVIFIYGARDNNVNPWIDSVGGSTAPGGTCVLTGGNFSATGNEVWLNSDVLDSSQTGGEPYKITGLASTNGGTQLSFVVPATGIEPGAVHVKAGGGNGHKYLSEGEPFDYGGAGNTDRIALTGPTVATAGSTVFFDFSGAGANQPTYLLWSLSNAGTTIQGHPFDIGAPWNVGAVTTSDATGAGSWTVQVPQRAAGATVYLEVGQDDNGTILDSNLLTLSIY